jgi:hypothetical protein
MGLSPTAVPAVRTSDGHVATVYNFSQLGLGPLGQLLSLRRLLANGIHPDWVLVEVWPPLLSDDQAWHEENRLAPTRFYLADVPVIFRHLSDPWKVCGQLLEGLAIPVASQRVGLLRSYAPGWFFHDLVPEYQAPSADPDASGWSPISEPSPGGVEHRRRLESVLGFFGPLLSGQYRIRPAADRALRELIELCRGEGIRLAIYTMPEASRFRGIYAPQARHRVQDYLDGLHREYRVPVVDTRDWAADGDFFDGFHLLRPGALAFSRRFGREVLGPLVGGQVSN